MASRLHLCDANPIEEDTAMRPVKHKRIDAELEAFESLTDDAAESMAEEFIASATSAQAVAEDARDEPGFGEELAAYYGDDESEE
jgi:hypothetical protein